MSTPAQLPMIDDKGNAGLVSSDRVEAAQAAGFKPAVKMIGPDGSAGYVAQDRVDAARQAKFAIAPQPGVQRMATPEGQLTYALPAEVDKFKASGHVPIQDNGNFRVEPLDGESNTDTMARAAKIGKNLPPEVMKQAIEAEKSTFTSGRIAANLVAGPAIAGAGLTAAAGAGVAGAAAGDAIASVPEMQYILSSPRLYMQWLLANPEVRSALVKGAIKGATTLGLSAVGAKYLSKFLPKFIP